MRNLGVLYAFLGGAIVGCGAAILFEIGRAHV